MSLVSCVKVIIKDIDTLVEEAEKLGLEFHEGQTTYKWYGQWIRDYHADDAAYKHGIDPKKYGTCTHALSVPNI